ncbi:MAG: branched-chain amino acid transport system substrate-binding protein [Acidimicrobiaceae bacterium]|jgi:branched-chain amino acid transport system substrate-binding protein
MRFKRASVLGLSAVLLLGVVSCSSDKKTATTAASGSATSAAGPIKIKISHLADQSSTAKLPNEANIRGMDVALDQLKEEGKIEITIERQDTGNDVAKAVSLMTENAGDSSIVWQFGPPFSGQFFAAIPLAEQLKMPIDSISSGGIFSGTFNDYTFRTSFSDGGALPSLFKYAKEKVKATKMAAIYTNDADQARTAGELFVKSAPDNGITVVATQTFAQNDINFSTQASEIAAKSPDAVYLATNVNAGLVIKALRAAGVTAPILASNTTITIPKDVFDTSGGNTKDLFFSSPFFPEDTRPVVKDFLQRFKTKFPDKTAGAQEALGYDALMFLATAAKAVQGEVTRESLRKAFGSVKYEGVTGSNMSFPKGNGDISREGVYILTIVAPGVVAPS